MESTYFSSAGPLRHQVARADSVAFFPFKRGSPHANERARHGGGGLFASVVPHFALAGGVTGRIWLDLPGTQAATALTIAWRKPSGSGTPVSRSTTCPFE